MKTSVRRILLTAIIMGACRICHPASAADPPTSVDALVEGFPALDELENHVSAQYAVRTVGHNLPASAPLNPSRFRTPAFPVDERWLTRPRLVSFSSATESTNHARSDEHPLTALLSSLDATDKEAAALRAEITAKNRTLQNKYLFDRLSGYARTDYGTEITGVFANGIGFGSFQQAFRQNYLSTYDLPLLQRYSRSSNWTRLLGGWSISSSLGVEPQLNEAIQVQQFLNNLHLSWSVALSYTFTGATIRKIADGQLAEEEALGKTASRAAAAREELLRKMAVRVEALSANPPVHDTRISSLRELYPQFELFQARYEQAQSCEERMEHFFTMKGLALSLLTLAGYDHPNDGASNLLRTWKKARFASCKNSL